MYGGSTTSILLNTPGESASIMTALEGHLMARAGRGGPALCTAAIGSFVAGTLATLALTFLAPLMASAALRFGPPEYFALTVLAFTAVSAVLGGSILRGLVSLFFGLSLGLVGIDALTGQTRFTAGIPQFLDGIDVVLVVVGLFAVGETLYTVSRRFDEDFLPIRGSVWMSRRDWARSWKPWLRGTLIGFPLGALPAGGGEIPTFLSYVVERRLTKHPEEFGRGAIEGVAGPEAANNASAAGTLVPLLTLALPTSATAAVLLAAFQQVRPSARPHALRARARARVGVDCEPVHWQLDAPRAQPPSRGTLGSSVDDPSAAALRRDSRSRQRRGLQSEPVRLRSWRLVCDWRGRVLHARGRYSARAGRDRLDPRSDR